MSHALQLPDAPSAQKLTPEYMRGVGRDILESIPKTKIDDYSAVLRVGQLFELFLVGVEILCLRAGGRVRRLDVVRAEMDEVYVCVKDMEFVVLTDFVFEAVPDHVRDCLTVIDAMESHQNRKAKLHG